MRELESRTARARAQSADSFGYPNAVADALRESGGNVFGAMLERFTHTHDASITPRLITRSPGGVGHQSGHKSSSGRRDDHDDDDDDDKGDKKGKKKSSKGGGKGKKKGKDDDDDDDDDKPKKHPIQPPAPHGPPPSFPHPFPHPPHLPPPRGPPPKGPHPPFHPTGGSHPKVALSSSADDDTLTTPVAKPTKSSASPTEPSAPPENTPESAPPHESQTYAGGTFTQPVTATTPLPKHGSQPHATSGSLPLSPAQSDAGGKKGFPLATAGILGGVLSFLLVSGIVWGIWFWMRRRRRARAPPAQWDFPPPSLRPQSDGITVSTRTISTTLPQFASAAEAGAPTRAAANANPFAHRDDGRERDPFASAPPTLRLGTIDAPLSRMFI